MTARAAKPKPVLFETYEAWAVERAKVRMSVAGKPLFCRTARLLNAPKYLVPGKTKEERQYIASKLLIVVRDRGVLVCTNGIWWARENGVRFTPPKPKPDPLPRAKPAKTKVLAPKRLPAKLYVVK